MSEEFNDPVTRQSFASENKYYLELAKQIAQVIKPIANDMGGQMSLPDVFCTVNRARGFEVIKSKLINTWINVFNCFLADFSWRFTECLFNVVKTKIGPSFDHISKWFKGASMW